LAYARLEAVTAVVQKIKVFWEVTPSLENVTGVATFILPSPAGSVSQKRRMPVPVQVTEILLMSRRKAGRLS
jgi:hypothetical protein